jgi:hypothetical protein
MVTTPNSLRAHARHAPGTGYCDECNLPAYRIVGDQLRIESRHNGEKHTTVLTLGQLIDKMQASKRE